MAALDEALKALSPIEFDSIPVHQLERFLSETFRDAQLLIDSVPIPPPAEGLSMPVEGRSRANTVSSIASSASEISASGARASSPPPNVKSLQSQWGKPVRLNARDNPLGISVYKLAGRDGKGAWFARRSVHEGLGFARWKKGLEKEFPETMKVQGGPGEGNIRGIGGERKVEHNVVDGVGKLEVYHLSAQFPGPTTPRDFVTLLLTSDSALTEDCGGVSEDKEIPRHFMVVSKPCIHPNCPEREGFIRGNYQSVEFIREIPPKKAAKKSASTTNLLDSQSLGKEAILRNAQQAQRDNLGGHIIHDTLGIMATSESNLTSSSSRQRGKTISYSEPKGWNPDGDKHRSNSGSADDAEINPVEWIMLTRSDPGGSVPRFMVERGTPSSIVADASKFLDWACSNDMDELGEDTPIQSDVESGIEKPERKSFEGGRLRDFQTNGHLAGLDGSRDPAPIETHQNTALEEEELEKTSEGGIYGIVTGAVSVAGAMVASHAPVMITNHLPGYSTVSEDRAPEILPARRKSTRRLSTSSEDSESGGSFVSAIEGDAPSSPTGSTGNLSQRTESSFIRNRSSANPSNAAADRELSKLEDRKRKLNEKLAKTRERELSKKSEDTEKEALAIARAEEKHQKEITKQEEKYKRELAKIQAKRVKEAQKAEDKRRKLQDRDEKTRLTRELEEVRAERDILRVERDLLRKAMGNLQAENTALAARVGKLGLVGEQVLKDVREEVGASSSGRLRATSLMGGSRSVSASASASASTSLLGAGAGAGGSKATSIRSIEAGSIGSAGSSAAAGTAVGSGPQKENLSSSFR